MVEEFIARGGAGPDDDVIYPVLYRHWDSTDLTNVSSYTGTTLPEITNVNGSDWSKPGFTFIGWYRESTDTMYQPGDTAIRLSGGATPATYDATFEETVESFDLVISYNNSTITSLSDSGIVVLDTAGKLVNNNITIEYTKSGGGQSGGGDSLASLIQRTITSASDSTITTIGDYAFANCYSLNSALFPACTTIGSYAFTACRSLIIASFSACTTIGSSAFLGCGSLTTASFPKCSTISSYAFRSCINLTTMSFPLCTSIDNFTFAGCNKLLTAVFPSCTIISTGAFQSCQSLTMVSFPMCARISNSAFRYCFNLLSFYVLTSSVPTLASTDVFSSTPIWNYTTSTGGEYGSIFVKASMLSAFQTATNWSVFGAHMVGLTDEQIAALGI